MSDEPRNRRYKPSGRPIDDGRDLFHMYGRVWPWVLEYVKQYAEENRISDAQAVGTFLTEAVESYGLAQQPGTEEYDNHVSRLERAHWAQRTKPVRPARKTTEEQQ